MNIIEYYKQNKNTIKLKKFKKDVLNSLIYEHQEKVQYQQKLQLHYAIVITKLLKKMDKIHLLNYKN